MWKFAIPAIFFLTSSVHAGITFTIGNNPQANEENVQFNSDSSGTAVFGQTNQQGITVQFSSASSTLVVSSSGQAKVAAESGSLTNITVSVPGGSFQDLIVNPINGAGQATYTVVANEPGGGTHTSTFTTTLANGNNFLTIVAGSGETISSVTIDASGGFADLRQPRISGATLGTNPSVTPVPEPGTIVIVMGLGSVALSARYRRQGARLIAR